MEIVIDPHMSANENISAYYDKSKKIKAKISGLNRALEDTRRKIREEEAKASAAGPPEKKIQRKKEWYEAFHWFFTSGKHLVIAGKDMKSNQMAVTRHLEKSDLYFHADIQGAPSVILKGGQGAGDGELKEAASFAASYSSAWKKGVGSISVYHVLPEQVTTSAPSGEYLPKGGFIIRGSKTYEKNSPLKLWVSYFDEKLQTLPYRPKKPSIPIVPGGNDTKNDVAKKILKIMRSEQPGAAIDTDWLLQRLPNGSSIINKG